MKATYIGGIVFVALCVISLLMAVSYRKNHEVVYLVQSYTVTVDNEIPSFWEICWRDHPAKIYHFRLADGHEIEVGEDWLEVDKSLPRGTIKRAEYYSPPNWQTRDRSVIKWNL